MYMYFKICDLENLVRKNRREKKQGKEDDAMEEWFEMIPQSGTDVPIDFHIAYEHTHGHQF